MFEPESEYMVYLFADVDTPEYKKQCAHLAKLEQDKIITGYFTIPMSLLSQATKNVYNLNDVKLPHTQLYSVSADWYENLYGVQAYDDIVDIITELEY